MMRAAMGNHVDVMVALSRMDASAEKATADGWTPLMIAAYDGNHDIVKLLVLEGANGYE